MPIAELPGDSGFALLGESLWQSPQKEPKVLPHHPGLARSPSFHRCSGAGVQGPSMALYAFRGIHAAHSATIALGLLKGAIGVAR